jgi:hypothetical protein
MDGVHRAGLDGQDPVDVMAVFGLTLLVVVAQSAAIGAAGTPPAGR